MPVTDPLVDIGIGESELTPSPKVIPPPERSECSGEDMRVTTGSSAAELADVVVPFEAEGFLVRAFAVPEAIAKQIANKIAKIDFFIDRGICYRLGRLSILFVLDRTPHRR